jgi:hypothetical protein
MAEADTGRSEALGEASASLPGDSADTDPSSGWDSLSFGSAPAPESSGPQQAWSTAFDESDQPTREYDIADDDDFQMTSDTASGTPEPASVLLGLCAFVAVLGGGFAAATGRTRRHRHHYHSH